MRRRALAGLAVSVAAVIAASPAQAATESLSLRFEASDGVELAATVTGEAPLRARPTVVEFSPYGRNTGTLDPGPDYNKLLVQIRGTGDSDGRFDALGPRTQADVAEVLRWACRQQWSNGKLALNGFSASAITIYNSLHHKLHCVKAMVLKSGTFELYRDLIWPGGIFNAFPATGVMLLIGAPALAQGFDRAARDPGSGFEVMQGLFRAGLEGLAHSTLDKWWRQRGFRGDVNHVPTLVVSGFFDVESRGAFQGYQRLRRHGAHLLVIGAHDGAPAGTDAGYGEMVDWLERYLRGKRNGVERHPRVQMWLADGDREDWRAGKFARVIGRDWPDPRTRWRPYKLTADGALTRGDAGRAASLSYPALPSVPTMTDLPTTGLAGAAGLDQLTNALPMLTEMDLQEPAARTFVTAPLERNLLAAGPGSVELRLASSSGESGVWAVVSDIHPDGTAHPVATGRLSTAFPEINRRKSLRERRSGAIVQPYSRFQHKSPPAPGESRRYRIELWPIGNRFKAGHRIGLHVVGASAFSMPSAPGLNMVAVGAGSGSRLLLPTLPSDVPK